MAIETTRGLDVIDDDRLLLAATYWSLIRGDRDYPLRSDLDPGAMPPSILPWISLIEVLDGRFRCRLAGTGLRDHIGRDITGDYVENLCDIPEYNDFAISIYSESREFGTCMYTHAATLADNETRTTRKFVAPLSKAGDDVDILFCCQVFDRTGNKNAGSAWDSLTPNPPIMLRNSKTQSVLFKELSRYRLEI